MSSYASVIFELVTIAFSSSYKIIALIPCLIGTFLFYFFCFSIYKMFDSEYNTDNYISPKISIRAIMKNPNILEFVPDHLKTKKSCKHVIKNNAFFK